MEYPQTFAIQQQTFLLYLLVGGLNTLFGYSLYAFFVFLGFYYLWAGLLSTILGLMFNYQTYSKLVFFHKKNVWLRFCLGCLFMMGANALLLKLGTLLSSNDYLLGIMVLFPSAIISYLWNKSMVFKECS